MNAINAWTKQQTHGKITKLFDRLDPSTVLVLANAIYFHAAWARAFSPDDTVPGLFTTASGEQVDTKFMTGPVTDVAQTPDYAAAQIPYRGNRFAALAVGQLSDTDALVKLPRFTTRSTMDLVPTLKALGMGAAFDGADLSGLTPSRGLSVDQVVQRVYLGVGEKGTTAAAVTGISVIPLSTTGGGQPEIVFDHPFLFLVRDTTTGAILFASEINDPTAG